MLQKVTNIDKSDLKAFTFKEENGETHHFEINTELLTLMDDYCNELIAKHSIEKLQQALQQDWYDALFAYALEKLTAHTSAYVIVTEEYKAYSKRLLNKLNNQL